MRFILDTVIQTRFKAASNDTLTYFAPYVLDTMTECRCRHLIVMENDQMVGIVSVGDLVKHMLQEKEVQVEQLSQYISGSY